MTKKTTRKTTKNNSKKAKKQVKTKIIIKKSPASIPLPGPIFPEQAIQNIITYVKAGPKEMPFKEEYIPIILKLMSEGVGLITVAAVIGVSYSVFYKWSKKNKVAKEIIKQGKLLEEAWWTEQGRRNLYNKDFNHVLFMMNMSNRFNWATNKGKVEKKIDKHTVHRLEGSAEITHRVKEEYKREPDKASEVLRILKGSGFFTKPDPVRGTTDNSDTETN